MTEQVVVLGSGYAGAGAVRSLEDELDGEADVVWVSDTDYHLVLHESHRCISDPDVAEKITFPVEDIKSPRTQFVQGRVVGIDVDERTVILDDGEVDYDYLLVGIGSRTAFFGIEGLETHAHTLKGLDEIFPGNDDSVQAALRKRLEARDVQVLTGEFVSEVDEDVVHIGEDDELPYDVLVWTGGIAGWEAVRDADIEKDERNYRLNAGRTFQTSDERVFAIGDAALIEQNSDPAPPSAQAAWQAAAVVGVNIARAIRDQPLKEWTYKDKGTVISVGESAVAHDVSLVPFVGTFGGFPARMLKKIIAARWIASVAGYREALAAWPDM